MQEAVTRGQTNPRTMTMYRRLSTSAVHVSLHVKQVQFRVLEYWGFDWYLTLLGRVCASAFQTCDMNY